MLAIDIYVNETTRHADVVLPGPQPLERSHFDLAFYQLSVRNVANYSPPCSRATARAEWELLLRLAGVVSGQGPNADVAAIDDLVISTLVQREVAIRARRVEGRDPAELIAELEPRRGPERMLDLMLRVGPYGDAFGAAPNAPALTLDELEREPARRGPRPAPAAPARGAAHAVGQGRARAGERSWRTSSGCGRARARAATAAWC